MIESTEERVWIKHVLRLTLCKCCVRKLLNCNSFASVEKTGRVISELHTCCTQTMMWRQVVDNKTDKVNVTTEWE